MYEVCESESDIEKSAIDSSIDQKTTTTINTAIV